MSQLICFDQSPEADPLPVVGLHVLLTCGQTRAGCSIAEDDGRLSIVVEPGDVDAFLRTPIEERWHLVPQHVVDANLQSRLRAARGRSADVGERRLTQNEALKRLVRVAPTQHFLNCLSMSCERDVSADGDRAPDVAIRQRAIECEHGEALFHDDFIDRQQLTVEDALQIVALAGQHHCLTLLQAEVGAVESDLIALNHVDDRHRSQGQGLALHERDGLSHLEACERRSADC